MDLQTVASLFTLFSGEAEVTDYLPLLRAAEAEVRCALRPEADISDMRLCYFAAALANWQYRMLLLGQERTAAFAGTLSKADSEKDLAWRLVQSYRGICAELLRDDAFFFHQTGGRT